MDTHAQILVGIMGSIAILLALAWGILLIITT